MEHKGACTLWQKKKIWQQQGTEAGFKYTQTQVEQINPITVVGREGYDKMQNLHQTL